MTDTEKICKEIFGNNIEGYEEGQFGISFQFPEPQVEVRLSSLIRLSQYLGHEDICVATDFSYGLAA